MAASKFVQEHIEPASSQIATVLSICKRKRGVLTILALFTGMQLAYSMYLFLLYRSQLDRSNNLKRLDMDVRTFLVSFDLCSWVTAEAYEFEVEEETWRYHACLTRRTDTIFW